MILFNVLNFDLNIENEMKRILCRYSRHTINLKSEFFGINKFAFLLQTGLLDEDWV